MSDIESATASQEDRTLAMLTHLSGIILGFIVPLVIWLVNKDKSEFASAHAREAVNFNLSMFLYALAAGVIGIVLVGATVLTLGIGALITIPAGIVLLCVIAAIAVMWLVCSVLAAIRAWNGEHYRYPLTMRFFGG